MKFWRLLIDHVDTVSDGLSDANERWLALDVNSSRTGRSDVTDLQGRGR